MSNFETRDLTSFVGSFAPLLLRHAMVRCASLYLFCFVLSATVHVRRAKFYRLTAAGRKRLAAEAEHWSDMSTAIARIMQTA